MRKSKQEFFTKVNEMIMNQQYDVEVVEKLLNIIVMSKMLADRENNKEVEKTLLNICIVGESLAKKLYLLKDK